MMGEPRVISEGYAYIDEKTEKWCLKKDAPEWAVKEFEEFFNCAKGESDNGVTTKY